MSEEVKLDFSRVPVRPTSKKEVKLLETALIVGTLYRPEILELIRDPFERATWLDSLAIAAAALAREKAGYSISEIAEELGRAEATIRAHLQGKTKAGRIVRETYEKLVRGELEVKLPFLSAQQSCEELRNEVEVLRRENEKLREQVEKCKNIEEVKSQLKQLEEKIRDVERENEELKRRVSELEKYEKLVTQLKNLLGC